MLLEIIQWIQVEQTKYDDTGLSMNISFEKCNLFFCPAERCFQNIHLQLIKTPNWHTLDRVNSLHVILHILFMVSEYLDVQAVAVYDFCQLLQKICMAFLFEQHLSDWICVFNNDDVWIEKPDFWNNQKLEKVNEVMVERRTEVHVFQIDGQTVVIRLFQYLCLLFFILLKIYLD